MAKATSSRGGSRKTEGSVYSDTLAADSQNGNTKKRARRANVARHARKCTVCHHKDREFIDQDYLRWLSPKKIAREYKISHHSVVYRHADATGLRTQRRASLRATLENFIEQAEDVRATAGSVVAAVRLYAQINDQGQWTPPVRRHIVEHRYTTTAEGSAPAPVPGVSNAAGSQAATSAHSSQAKNDPENSQERSSKGAHSAAPPAAAHKNSVPPSATGGVSPVASITAGSAVPSSASPDKFGAVPPERNARAPQTTGDLSADRLSPVSSNAAGSQAATTVATSATPPAKAHKNSAAVDATGSLRPVATITVGSAVPLCSSPDKFPAVRIASIDFAPDPPVSNREHVELEHAATR